MKPILTAALVLLAAAPVAAAAQQTPPPAQQAQLPSVQLPPELDRVLRDYERAWQAGDAAGLAALFTEDGFALPLGRPPVHGREALTRHYADSGMPLSLRALGYAADGSVGYIVGGFSSRPGQPDGGKFVLALRRGEDGRWLIAADIDNVNFMPRRGPAPPPGAPAPAGSPPPPAP